MDLKHIPILVSISSNLIQEPIFICYSNRRDLVSSLVNALEKFATQSKLRIKKVFFQSETAIRSNFAPVLEVLIFRRTHCVCSEAEDFNSKNRSTHFIRKPKNQLIDLQEQFD